MNTEHKNEYKMKMHIYIFNLYVFKFIHLRVSKYKNIHFHKCPSFTYFTKYLIKFFMDIFTHHFKHFHYKSMYIL